MVPDPAAQSTCAVTIDALPEKGCPWLMQLSSESSVPEGDPALAASTTIAPQLRGGSRRSVTSKNRLDSVYGALWRLTVGQI
jgi:hypothetical protein